MGGSKKKATIGWKYYMGLHMLLGLRVDSLLKISVQDRIVWSGEKSGGSISVNKPEVFGGDTREGGISGTVDLLMGENSQTPNSYLESKLGAGEVPTYRGMMSVVWRRPWLQSNNSYIFPHKYQVRRTQTLTDGAAQPYLAKANINNSLNPAHVVREALTNTTWGMGYPTSSVDNTAFEAMADTLFTEGFGFTFFWNTAEQEIQDFIQMVMDHVNGVLYVDPSTGQYVMKLIRADYTLSSLLVLDESNVSSLSYERRGWGETVNQVTVRYTDMETGEDRVTPPVQDIGNIQLQEAIIAEDRRYPGVVDPDIANKLALRDLKFAASPLAKVTIKANREAYNLLPGSVFKLSWAPHGISTLVCRVSEVDYGTLQKGEITIQAVEDVFAMPDSSFVAAQPTSFVNPLSAPAPCPQEIAYEAGYWEVQLGLASEGLTTNPFGTDFGIVVACGTAPSGSTFNMDLATRVGAAAYEVQGTGLPVSYAELDGAIGQEDSGTYSVKNHVLLDLVEVTGMYAFAYIGGAGGEMVAVTAVDEAANTVTLIRGVCDSTPIAHADSTKIFFVGESAAIDFSEYLAPETVDAKLMPTTPLGTLDQSLATALQVVLNTRQQRPYPPGNVQINGVRYPVKLVGNLNFTWSHRDRTLQEAYFNDQTEGNIGPEAGTTYTLRIYESGNLRRTYSGLTGTSQAYSLDTLLADFVGSGPVFSVRIHLESIRDGYTSWRYQQRDFILALPTYVDQAVETDQALSITYA